MGVVNFSCCFTVCFFLPGMSHFLPLEHLHCAFNSVAVLGKYSKIVVRNSQLVETNSLCYAASMVVGQQRICRVNHLSLNSNVPDESGESGMMLFVFYDQSNTKWQNNKT